MTCQRPIPAAHETASLKILVVDDEEPVRQVLEAILTLDGHRVGLAADGLAALGRLQAEHWDLLLTDRQMPGMDGEELARTVRALSPHTPVILLTGLPPPAAGPGVDLIITKPFTLATIAEGIRRCLTARRERAAAC